jgi:hypothetical protein
MAGATVFFFGTTLGLGFSFILGTILLWPLLNITGASSSSELFELSSSELDSAFYYSFYSYCCGYSNFLGGITIASILYYIQ